MGLLELIHLILHIMNINLIINYNFISHDKSLAMIALEYIIKNSFTEFLFFLLFPFFKCLEKAQKNKCKGQSVYYFQSDSLGF